MLRKRPCALCHQWFYPHPRVRSRQKVCSQPACQAQRRKQTQAAWRAKNPDYDIARYFQRRFVEVNEGHGIDPLTIRGTLHRVPWDLVQDEMGAKLTDMIIYLARLLQREVQDQIRSHLLDSKGKNDRHLAQTLQDPIRDGVSVIPGETHAETTRDMPSANAPP